MYHEIAKFSDTETFVQITLKLGKKILNHRVMCLKNRDVMVSNVDPRQTNLHGAN